MEKERYPMPDVLDRPSARTSGPAGQAFARSAVTVTLALVAAFTFAFSFTNVWALGRRLGVAPWAAPMIAPAVDLSVAALLLALHQLTARGVPPCELRSARILLLFSGVATLALNAADPILRHAYGRAAFDAVGPLLLVGWSEVGPALLIQIHLVSSPTRPGTPRRTATAKSDLPTQSRSAAKPDTAETDTAKVGGTARVPYAELLDRARRLDLEHRKNRGRPVSADTVRAALGIGSAQARRLVAIVRAEHPIAS
jgi:hypothetical protein